MKKLGFKHKFDKVIENTQNMCFTKKKLSDAVSKEILTDTVDFKLVLARHFLERIPNQVSSDLDWNHFVLESNVESFLFYSNLAIESLAMKIDEVYHLQPLSTYLTRRIEEDSQSQLWNQTGGNREQLREGLTIYKVKKLLNQSNPEQKSLYDIILRYFEDPKQSGASWDLSHSSLWLLRELRNHIAHAQIMNRSISVGMPANETIFLFRFGISDYAPADPTINRQKVIGEKLSITTDRPYDYFENLFQHLLRFIDEVRSIIQYNYMSSQHKNPLNFELKS